MTEATAHRSADAHRDLVRVQPLNDAPSAPLCPDAALAVTRKHCFVGADAAARFRAEHAAGAPGPWHFVYGFMSVSITRAA